MGKKPVLIGAGLLLAGAFLSGCEHCSSGSCGKKSSPLAGGSTVTPPPMIGNASPGTGWNNGKQGAVVPTAGATPQTWNSTQPGVPASSSWNNTTVGTPGGQAWNNGTSGQTWNNAPSGAAPANSTWGANPAGGTTSYNAPAAGSRWNSPATGLTSGTGVSTPSSASWGTAPSSGTVRTPSGMTDMNIQPAVTWPASSGTGTSSPTSSVTPRPSAVNGGASFSTANHQNSASHGMSSLGTSGTVPAVESGMHRPAIVNPGPGLGDEPKLGTGLSAPAPAPTWPSSSGAAPSLGTGAGAMHGAPATMTTPSRNDTIYHVTPSSGSVPTRQGFSTREE